MQENIVMTDLDQLRLQTLLRSALLQHGQDQDRDKGLRDLLEIADVVPAAAVAANVVTMNSKIVCRGGPLGDKERTLTLVYPDRADSSEGRISILSPLGLALYGVRAGSTVEVEAPGREQLFVHVCRILFQPEAHEEWNL